MSARTGWSVSLPEPTESAALGRNHADGIAKTITQARATETTTLDSRSSMPHRSPIQERLIVQRQHQPEHRAQIAVLPQPHHQAGRAVGEP